jgi:hypothetical protein
MEATNRRTENTMAKGKRTKVYDLQKELHKKLKTGQNEPH